MTQIKHFFFLMVNSWSSLVAFIKGGGFEDFPQFPQACLQNQAITSTSLSVSIFLFCIANQVSSFKWYSISCSHTNDIHSIVSCKWHPINCPPKGLSMTPVPLSAALPHTQVTEWCQLPARLGRGEGRCLGSSACPCRIHTCGQGEGARGRGSDFHSWTALGICKDRSLDFRTETLGFKFSGELFDTGSGMTSDLSPQVAGWILPGVAPVWEGHGLGWAFRPLVQTGWSFPPLSLKLKRNYKNRVAAIHTCKGLVKHASRRYPPLLFVQKSPILVNLDSDPAF